jgi:hypothetical protein
MPEKLRLDILIGHAESPYEDEKAPTRAMMSRRHRQKRGHERANER